MNNLETKITNPRTHIERKINEMGPWFHNLHLPDGTQTAPDHPLGDFPLFKWKQIEKYIPKNLDGWKVLDIGCNAGFYSIELAKRGAIVMGIDIDNHYLRQAKWAANYFGVGDKIIFKKMPVYDLAFSKEKYDLILFMGVFYHLRYPLLALDIVSNLFTKEMIFQTLTMPGDTILKTPKNLTIDKRKLMRKPGWPVMAFIENSLAGDDTNWWAPNHACVEALLRSCNLKITGYPTHEIYVCEHRIKSNFKRNGNSNLKDIVRNIND